MHTGYKNTMYHCDYILYVHSVCPRLLFDMYNRQYLFSNIVCVSSIWHDVYDDIHTDHNSMIHLVSMPDKWIYGEKVSKITNVTLSCDDDCKPELTKSGRNHSNMQPRN